MSVSVQANFGLKGRNPDVLTCIANLSNDEVFTPPAFANRMLDTLEAAWAADHNGANLWADPNVRFLDPGTKSGVFLREIAIRLIKGLEGAIPDLQTRVDHILTRQVYGIATSYLTSLLARRTLYCSKNARGKHSVAKSLPSDDGNIWFQRLEHTWVSDRCTHCGANRDDQNRGEGFDTRAYAFIHTNDIRAHIARMFGPDVRFDVIIGNPPSYYLHGNEPSASAPIYQHFITQAKILQPRYLSMVIPARWFAGGRGLDEFREAMLGDDHLRSLDDYLSSSDVFPGGGVGGKGGVCSFLWSREKRGLCRVSTNFKDWPVSTAIRPLLEKGADVFIRFNEGLSILKKVIAAETGQAESLTLTENKRFDPYVSSARAFGLRTFFKGAKEKSKGDVLVYQNGGVGYTPRSSITTGLELIDKWKIFVSYAAPGTGNRDTYPHRIISTPFIGEPGSISSETYLCIGPFDSKSETESVLSYLSCRLTRLLILLHKSSQHVTRKVYTFVPKQDWSKQWTDKDLYAKYGLTAPEIAFIEQVVRPMDDLNGSLFDDAPEDSSDDE